MSTKKKTLPSISITKAQFTKMNKKRRIVHLAKDVLLQLASEKLIAEHGTYCSMTKRGRYINKFSRAFSKKSAQDIINAADTTCHVCAKGALICSYVSQFNGVVMEDFNGAQNNDLDDIFGYEMWDQIEMLFEGMGDWQNHDMEFIMNHLITNKGELVMSAFKRKSLSQIRRY